MQWPQCKHRQHVLQQSREMEAATAIQKIYQGHAEREEVEALQQVRAASLVDVARPETEDEPEKAAATAIQSAYRGHVGRRRAKRKRQERRAATAIQTLFRGHVGRMIVRWKQQQRKREREKASEVEDQAGAASAIQSIFRGYAGRKRPPGPAAEAPVPPPAPPPDPAAPGPDSSHASLAFASVARPRRLSVGGQGPLLPVGTDAAGQRMRGEGHVPPPTRRPRAPQQRSPWDAVRVPDPGAQTPQPPYAASLLDSGAPRRRPHNSAPGPLAVTFRAAPPGTTAWPKRVDKRTPGPGDYKLPPLVGKGGPTYSFAGRWGALFRERPADPGPGAYDADGPAEPSTKKFGRGRRYTELGPHALRTPGPGTYSPRSHSVDYSPQFVPDSAAAAQRHVNPRPGAYNVRVPRGRAFSTCRIASPRRLKKAKQPGPGTGDCNLPPLVGKACPSVSMRSPVRGARQMAWHATDPPGPGTYDWPSLRAPKRFTAGRHQLRLRSEATRQPGPGTCGPPGEFGFENVLYLKAVH